MPDLAYIVGPSSAPVQDRRDDPDAIRTSAPIPVLAILKAMHDLLVEALGEPWVENPYFPLFCGEAFFRHTLLLERSSMTCWRQRMTLLIHHAGLLARGGGRSSCVREAVCRVA